MNFQQNTKATNNYWLPMFKDGWFKFKELIISLVPSSAPIFKMMHVKLHKYTAQS